MIKTVFHKILMLLALALLAGCSGLYPIKHRLISVEDQTFPGYHMPIKPENFYQLRVTETVDFIPVNEENSDRTLVSDLPYRSFQQDTVKQDTVYRGGPLTIEEVYMYMDGIHSKNSSGSMAQYGYVLYLMTYAAVDGNIEKAEKRDISKVRKYFNDPDRLYLNTVRNIRVGYWIKNSEDDLLLFFQLDNGTINVHKGHLYKDRLGFSEVAHPKKGNRRIDSYNVLRSMVDFKGLSRKGGKPVDTIDYGKLDILFDKIYESVALVQLNNVFDLNQKDELLFINIPESKDFVLEQYGISETSQFYTVKEFVLQDPELFVNAKKANEGDAKFQFKTKFVDFRTPD